MQEVIQADRTAPEDALWTRIAAHSFERPEHRLTFVGRLARDRGWTLDFARGAIREEGPAYFVDDADGRQTRSLHVAHGRRHQRHAS